MQAQGGIGLFARERGGLVERDLGKGDGGLAGAEQGFELGHGAVQIFGRDAREVVRVQPAFERVGQHHGVIDGRERDAVAAQREGHALDVLADLEDRAVFQHGFEKGQHLVAR